MALTDIISRQVVVLKADASQFKAEMKSAGAAEQAVMKERLAGLEQNTAALERNSQKFGLWAAAGVAGFSLISSSVKKYEDHLKSLGASGAAELKKLQDQTGKLSQAQDTLQISIGKLAAAALPAAQHLASMANSLADIVNSVGQIVNRVVSDVPGGGLIAGAIEYAGPVNQARHGLRWGLRGATAAGSFIENDVLGYTDGFYTGGRGIAGFGRKRSASSGSGGPVNSDPTGSAARLAGDRAESREIARLALRSVTHKLENAIGDLAGGFLGDDDKPAKRGPKGPNWLQRGVNRFGQMGDEYARRQDYAAMLEEEAAAGRSRSTGSAIRGEIAGGHGAVSGELEAGAEALRKFQEEFEAGMALNDARESLLSQWFGPVEEFNLYTAAFEGLSSVVSAGFDAWITGSKSVGKAMQEALHGFAKQLAGEAALQVLRHGAYALGSLAFGDAKGAATHGIAALKWGGVLLAAGTYAKVSAPGVGGGANANATAGIWTGSRGDSGRDRSSSVTVVMGDSFAGDSPRYVARKVRRNIDNARQYATYGQEGS